MLDLFNIKKKKQFDSKQTYFNSSTKHFSSPLREWDNSIYAFNSNTIKLVPSTTIVIVNMIKSYFNLFNKQLEKKARTKKLMRKIRRISSNKYYVGNGGFKHTNDKIMINLYVFNRQRHNYLSIFRKRYLKRFFDKSDLNLLNKEKVLDKLKATLLNLKKEISTVKLSNLMKIISYRFYIKDYNKNEKSKLLRKKMDKKIKALEKRMKLKKVNLKRIKMKKEMLKIRLIKRLRLINLKGIKAVKTININKNLLTKAFDTIKSNKNLKIYNVNGVYKYAENFYKKLIKRSLRKMRMYFYYKQLLFVNKSKTNYNYLQHLKIYLQKIFNKNVEFNVINVRRFYLNSDIMSESITMKISKKRKRMLKYLNRLKNKVKIWDKKPSYIKTAGFNTISMTNDLSNNLNMKDHIHNNLKYKHVTGFRLEANGRLSKRFTASRSVHKLRYKGNLLDVNTSYRGMSSNILKGNLKSNIQYTKIKSKSRIGSFGIKGWVNGN